MTPFTLEGTFADVWTLRFDLEGFDSRALVVRGPQDIDLALSRTPAVHFDLGGRVDAVPAPIGDGSTGEYIVCDRKGAIARMAWGGEMRWRLDIKDVSGVARRPVTMPGLQGHQIFLTEAGGAWLLNPEEATLRGPLKLPSPPVFGPVVIGDEARALLLDKSVVSWTSSLKPEYGGDAEASGLDESLRHGFQGLFNVQRPTGSGNTALRTATSDGSGWSILVEDGWYRIVEDVPAGDDERRAADPFLIRRDGSWAYVAWEAPSVKGDPPVLWISDGLGLRAFLPPNTARTITR
jgi:hypothetical protein